MNSSLRQKPHSGFSKEQGLLLLLEVHYTCVRPEHHAPIPTPARRKSADDISLDTEKCHHAVICFPSHSHLTISLPTLVRHLPLEQRMIRSAAASAALSPPPSRQLGCISGSHTRVLPERMEAAVTYCPPTQSNTLNAWLPF